jgi:large subunit ribosomal protein L21
VYAIVEAGGKQYRVQEGDILKLDRLKGEEGDLIELGRVLLVGGETTIIGSPVVAGAVINAKILDHKRDKKKIVFRYKSKKRYRVKKGHRQPITRIQIESILPNGK